MIMLVMTGPRCFHSYRRWRIQRGGDNLIDEVISQLYGTHWHGSYVRLAWRQAWLWCSWESGHRCGNGVRFTSVARFTGIRCLVGGGGRASLYLAVARPYRRIAGRYPAIVPSVCPLSVRCVTVPSHNELIRNRHPAGRDAIAAPLMSPAWPAASATVMSPMARSTIIWLQSARY